MHLTEGDAALRAARSLDGGGLGVELHIDLIEVLRALFRRTFGRLLAGEIKEAEHRRAGDRPALFVGDRADD